MCFCSSNNEADTQTEMNEIKEGETQKLKDAKDKPTRLKSRNQHKDKGLSKCLGDLERCIGLRVSL